MSDFYPRPPRGGRLARGVYEAFTRQFLSPPSARRATGQHQGQRRRMDHFYPRPPRGGRRRTTKTAFATSRNFYPRPPRGGRPRSMPPRRRRCRISIPALREEGDYAQERPETGQGDFYPRPPRGGRLDPHRFTAVSLDISIHALREEGDLLAEIVKPVELISIHALREEGDFFSAVLHPAQSDFYPRPPRGGRPEDAQGTSPLKYFYPRPPRGGRRQSRRPGR